MLRHFTIYVISLLATRILLNTITSTYPCKVKLCVFYPRALARGQYPCMDCFSFLLSRKIFAVFFSCFMDCGFKLSSFSDSINDKAVFFMLQGKTLNVLPSYSPEAEEALSKAVKLDPKLVEAWNQLGENYWKKGKVPLAKNCFTGALNHVRNKYEI